MSRIIVQNATSGKELLWRHIKIKKSLDNICHTLELEIPAGERVKVHKHEKIEVRYENALVKDSGSKRLVTTVMIDEITSSVDVSKHSVLVIGRSPARDIIDSTWSATLVPKKEFTCTLFAITQSICKQFGFDCVIIPSNQGDITKEVSVFQWQNESPWTKLIAEADSQGFILTSNEAGGLYIWRPEAVVRDASSSLIEGRNIKTIEWKENGAEQYHEYIVTGGGGTPVSIIDNTCNNNRVLTIDLTNPIVEQEKLKRRAETEMNRRKENRVTVTVSGWGLTDPQIKNLGSVTSGKEIFWVPNLLIPVSMPSLGLRANLLIAEVEQEADETTMSSTITLVNRSAYL